MTLGTFTFTPLLSLTSSFNPAGTSHSAGPVPDPGSTMHGQPYILGDNAVWLQLTGPGVTFADNTYTITANTGSSLALTIVQSAHGFSVGNVLTLNSGTYQLAQANSIATSVTGIVSGVTNTNTFILTTQGYVTGLSSLTAGSLHYLSASTAGALTIVQPNGSGQFVIPLLVADSASSGYFSTNLNYKAIIPNNTLQANIIGSYALPVSNTLTSVIDATLGSVQGDILYRNGSVWTVLPPGTNGQVLSTGGSSANISWLIPNASNFTTIATNGSTAQTLANKLGEVLSVKDFGATGNGTTDDTAAFIAAKNAWEGSIRTNLAPNSDGNKLGSLRIIIPAGSYLITSPQALLDSSFATRTYGMTWEGVAPGEVQILYQPTGTAGGFLLYNNDAVLRLRFKNISFNANSVNSHFMYSVSNGGAQDYGFDNCSWDGTWGYGFQLTGTNSNSEFYWNNCGIYDTWTSFLYSQTSDQFLNYWFNQCKIWSFNGTFLNFVEGGAIKIDGCDFSNYGASGTSNVLFNLLGTNHAFGVCSFICNDSRFELASNNAQVMYCQWPQGNVKFNSCDFSSQAAQSWTQTVISHEFSWNNTAGPAVLFDNCILMGVHEYIVGSSDTNSTKSVQYRNCDSASFIDFYSMFNCSVSSGNNVSGLPCISLTKCRGTQNSLSYPYWTASTVYSAGTFVISDQWVYQCSIGGTSGTNQPIGAGTVSDNTVTWISQNIYPSNQYITEGGVNASQVGGATNLIKSAVFRIGPGTWPTRLSASVPGSTRLILPPNSILIGVYLSLPAGVLSQSTAGSFIVQTDQSSPTSFINYTSSSGLNVGFSTSWTGYFNCGTSLNTRSIIFQAGTNVQQYAAHPALCYLSYICGG